jgi:predicted CoA-substrate-specific enzyme activase
MITAGIDIGHKTVKALIMENRRIVDYVIMVIAGGVEIAAKAAFDKLLIQTGIDRNNIYRVFATGVGRENVTFADGHHTEMLSQVKGAHFLFPGARTVIDIGAEGTRILKCDSSGNLTDFLMNDKCASGTGVFLETVAEMMEVNVSEIGPLSMRSSRKVALTTTCAVFAESEIVAEIHRGSSREDILWGVHESVASKIASISRRIAIEPELVVTGGVARNIGVIEALKSQLSMEIRVPETPEICGALGSALIALESD